MRFSGRRSFSSLIAFIVLLKSALAGFTVQFTKGMFLSNYNTLTPSVNYVMNMTIPGGFNVNNGSQVTVTFGNRFNITNVANCKYSLNASSNYTGLTCSVLPSVIGNTTTYIITFSSLSSSDLNIVDLNLFFTITNPWGAGTSGSGNQDLIVNFYTNSTKMGSGQTTITYFPSVMSGCTYSSDNLTTGVNSNKYITFFPTVPVLANSAIQITMPLWFSSISNRLITPTCRGVNNSDLATLNCTRSSTTNTTEDYIIRGFVNSTKTYTSAVVLSIQPLLNPWSTYPFGPIIFQLTNSGIVSQKCTGIYLNMTTPNSFSDVALDLPAFLNISTVYQQSSLEIYIRSAFPGDSGYLRIDFPGVNFTYVGLATPKSPPTNTSMILGGISAPLSQQGAIISMFTSFDIITPPSTRSFTLTFTTLYLVSGFYYPIESSSITYACQTGSLTAGSVTPNSYIVNDVTVYTINFTTANALFAGSYIRVIFPATLSVSGNCSSTNSSFSCSMTNATYANISVNASIPASTAISLTFNQVNNPNQASTTNSIQIYTYYDSGLDSMVDTLTSGLTVKAVARAITGVTITPASSITYALNNYDFSITTIDPIPTGGTITITFPSTISLGNVSIVSASFTNTTCSIGISGKIVTISSCFSSPFPAGTMTLTLSKINNPASMQPTSSFSIATAGPLGQVDYINSGLSITMTTAATSSNFTVVPTSKTVHALTSYTLTFTLAVPHETGDYFTFAIDSSMSISSLNCSSNYGVASVVCVIYNLNTVNVTFNATPVASIQIVISSIRNYDISNTSISFQAYFYNSANYQMQITNAVSTTFDPDTITSININNNQQIALYQNSNFTLTISSPFTIASSFSASSTSLVIVAPAEFTALANTSCSPTSGTCTKSNLTFTISPVGSSFSNFIVVLGNIKIPLLSIASTSFAAYYKYNGNDIAKVSTGVTISRYCTSPCQRCSSNQSKCFSCLPSPNTQIFLFSVNSSCLGLCPDGYYSNTGNNCQACIPPCQFCLDSVNCTKCVINTWLYQSTCSAVCPSTYYNDTSGVCLSCVGSCENCTTATLCTTCLPTFFFYNSSCLNASNCPATSFANSTSKKCDPCSSPCFSCLYTSASSCQSCISGYVLFATNTSCLLLCPYRYFNNSGTCTACVNPCGNCTSASICTSCLSDFLDSSLGKCVAAGSCPSGTIADSSAKTCAACATGCSACTSLTNCSSCSGIYLFYNYQCIISCPGSTFQLIGTCQNCAASCPTCSGSATSCTSCNTSLVLYSSSCIASCPSGSFNSSGVCQNCLSSCQSCTNGSSCTSCPSNTYLINGLCQSSCPSGTFQDVATGTCATCNANCSTCSGSATNCSTCLAGTIFYNNTCLSSCPYNYFPINGNCITCGSCITCSSATTCVQCYSGYYLFGGTCYSKCPDTGIADPSTMTCTQCDSSCLTCSGMTNNCTSCKGGTYLYKSVCFTTCPSGLIADGITNTCEVSTIGNLVYFPCSITFAIWMIIIIYSRIQYPKTEGVTSIASGLALILWFAWMILILTAATSDKALSASSKTTVLGAGMTGIMFSLGLGLAYNIWVKKNFNLDPGFSHWLDHNKYNFNSYRIIFALSCLTMPFFRMIYSRFFNRQNFSCYFIEGAQFLRISNWFTFFAIILCIMPQIFVCGFIIYLKQTYDQTLIYAIDVLLLSLFLLVFLIIDIASKGQDFFDSMIDEQPYLKRLKYNDLNQSASCLRFLDEDNKHGHKSQIGTKQKDQFFRMKVTFTDNLNKFGHLNTPMAEPIAPGRKVKTLPQDLADYPQLDPNQDDIVINQDLFFEEEERRRKREEEEEKQRRRREQQQALRRLREEQQEQRQRRRKRMEEDQDQQHEIQFPDLAAIQKLQQKGKNTKKSPTQLLNKFKTVDDKNISQKALKKLQQVAKKNGLNPEFMAETFGVQRNHNPQLLNAIIDKHNHVNREAVKQLFSSENNPQILQGLFGKNSTMDPQRLKYLLNDSNSAQMIKNLANSEQGIISPQIAKLLLDKNSKFSEQFVKQILGSENGMDSQRLKQMLKENPDKATREAALKALKKVGGNNLQNKQLLHNMLGQGSKLSNEAFIKAANQLPKSVLQKLFKQKSQTNDLIVQKLLNNPKADFKKLTPILQKPELAKELSITLGKPEDAQTLQRVISDLPLEIIQQLFGQKSQANDIIIQKVLKNKKIDLTQLTGVLSDPALVELLAHALNHEDPLVQQNILNLLKNGEKISPELLKEFLSKPGLMKKLLNNPVDPAFLVNLLLEDSKTDLKLLQKALDNMEPEQIAKIFSFSPQKNTDFAKMAKLFEANFKSDPKLIAQLLTPQMVNNIYSKSSSTKAQILNKLVEKGKKINSQQIIKIYGEDKQGVGFGSRDPRDPRDPDRKYNITDNNFKHNNTGQNFNILKEDQDSQMGFKKLNAINSMSRTDGVAGFLSPIHVGLPRGKKKGNNLFNVGSIDDISDDEEKTEYNQNQNGQKDEEEEYEVVDGVRRKRKRRIKKKPLDDIRLPSEQIYLQRLQAPHQKKKNLRKKKKKGNSSMPQLEAMDQDNQIYDLDF